MTRTRQESPGWSGWQQRNFLDDILSIKRQKGNGDIDPGTRSEADAIGRSWVNGTEVSPLDLKNGYGRTDGTRTYRLTTDKYGETKAHFQENFKTANGHRSEVKNVHMAIK